MSSNLNITFASDMPAASVEVVAPDMQVVERIMLAAGRSKTVNVPSEASFLRVHLPSGRVATLEDPGNLARVVSMQSILKQTTSESVRTTTVGSLPSAARVEKEASHNLGNLFEVDRYHMQRSWMRTDTIGQEGVLPLASFATARIFYPNSLIVVPGSSVGEGREAHWEVGGPPEQPPFTLQIERRTGSILEIRVPGDLQQAWARVDMLRDHSTLAYSVRLITGEPTADTIMNYLRRGDLYSAEAMMEWINEAEQLLLGKMRDPYAAAVGAYLLLRFKQFDRLHDWARNLANWFDFLPDGCVIWAWQLIHQSPSKKDEIHEYFLKAAARGLPIYSEGLRLLLDGLRLIGDAGQVAQEEVLKQAGVVLWDSPLTASIRTNESYSAGADLQPVVYDIAFAAKA